MYLAYATNPAGAAQQGMNQLFRAGFDYVSSTLGKDNNPVANGMANAIDAVGNWYAYTGNFTVQVLEFVTTPGRKLVG
ncbi:uncharacterized protein Z519_11744 [Cladophialophora bantiana CBS 173.52]|uniref:Uncharacterized protein n=1 Tax=Cladophialophora bantiana (strain ATCC 10958 / CBS 173.52 / CDC B-1940 / NIH 8579) TaxID=1442370 RepID=A0A0D2HA34_CLAB1|nr:uncharacterized protein Z519_11744 [Cladophialophora bantiana CBS 173.52]KIW87770.1 hypothetical protein Z519_11744 [Cladophialophora bantiana CBS 173.52]